MQTSKEECQMVVTGNLTTCLSKSSPMELRRQGILMRCGNDALKMHESLARLEELLAVEKDDEAFREAVRVVAWYLRNGENKNV